MAARPQIRNLPDDIDDPRADRAPGEGRDLALPTNGELTKVAEQRTPLHRLEVLSRIQDRLGKSEPRTFSRPPEDLIRDDRERSSR